MRGDARRLPVVVATTPTAIAATHGQRSLRHSSQGASPPQYCDSKTATSTATLAARTKAGKKRSIRAIASQIAQRHEPANQGGGKEARHQHQPPLDKRPHRPP